jgi:hypothetical protein
MLETDLAIPKLFLDTRPEALKLRGSARLGRTRLSLPRKDLMLLIVTGPRNTHISLIDTWSSSGFCGLGATTLWTALW